MTGSPTAAMNPFSTPVDSGSERSVSLERQSTNGRESPESPTTRVGTPSAQNGFEKDITASTSLDFQQWEKVPAQEAIQLQGEEHPHNFSLRKKWSLVVVNGIIMINDTIASSIVSTAATSIEATFGVGPELVALAIALYVLGYVAGPCFWAALSDRYGRYPVNTSHLLLLAIINVGCARSPNIGVLAATRFLAGCMAAAPNSNVGAAIADMFPPMIRAYPVLTYSLTASFGPIIGPILGGYISMASPESWRWCFYLTIISSTALLPLAIFYMPETNHEVLKRQKAKRLLKESGNQNFEPLSRVPTFHLHDFFLKQVSMPLKMVFTELPMAYAALWSAFSFGMLYIFFEAYPVVWGGPLYHWNTGQQGLAFLGVGIGLLIAASFVPHFNKIYLRARENAGKPVPEARLSMASLSAPLFVVGLLWFGWTAEYGVIWIVPMLGTIPIGSAVLFGLNSMSVYTTECYQNRAASGLAVLVMARSLCTVGLAFAGRPLFVNLGSGVACSVLAGICVAVIPVPLLLNRMGSRLRAKSKYAYVE